MNPLDSTKTNSYIESNTIVFYDKSKYMYVKEVDELNNIIGYTNDIDEALYIPNTINFKNSKKYTTLIQQHDIEPLNKIVKKITEVIVQGL